MARPAKSSKNRNKAKAPSKPAPPRKFGLIQRLRRVAIVLFLATTVPVLVLRWVPPPGSMFMLIDRLNALAHGEWQHRIHYRWVPWKAISPQAKLAVVASEDQTFANHLGFDFKAIGKAMEKNRSGKKIRGGSTITQQTAKNLFLTPSRSYLRKVLEAYFTTLIELSWPKQRILEVYLNIAEFGDGIYGVGAAGNIYFNKPASRLNSQEAALLAAVLPNPKLLRVEEPSAYLQQRQHWITGQMRYLSGRHFLDVL
jgi:monofunctional biosynthetic peptidoglycan transglycosylase